MNANHNRHATRTFTLRHPETDHSVDFIIDLDVSDGDAGAACIMDGDDPSDSGFCDMFRARTFYKGLLKQGYHRF